MNVFHVFRSRPLSQQSYNHVVFQVRIQRAVQIPPSPPAQQPESEGEAAERDELLDGEPAAEQQSDWL